MRRRKGIGCSGIPQRNKGWMIMGQKEDNLLLLSDVYGGDS